MLTYNSGMHNNPSKYGAIGKTFTNHLYRMPGSNMLAGQKFYEGRNFMMNRWDKEMRNAKSAYDRQEIQKKIDWANKTRPWEREVKHGGYRARNAEGYYNGMMDQYNAYAGQNNTWKQNAALKAGKAGMATGPTRYQSQQSAPRLTQGASGLSYDKRPMRERRNEIEKRNMAAGRPSSFGGGYKNYEVAPQSAPAPAPAKPDWTQTTGQHGISKSLSDFKESLRRTDEEAWGMINQARNDKAAINNDPRLWRMLTTEGHNAPDGYYFNNQ